MWRPIQLSIDVKMDELLNQSIRKSIQDSPYLKTWVNPEDMRRDVRSGLSSSNLNAYLMAAQVRRTVISYHRKMTGPYGWTVDFAKIIHQPGDPVSIDEWIRFHESVDLLSASEKFAFKMVVYGGFTVDGLSTQTGISHVTIDCLVSNARSRLHELVSKGC